jgi:hypothetical protein
MRDRQRRIGAKLVVDGSDVVRLDNKFTMVWEDMRGGPGASKDGEELNFIRDFVLHGGKLRNQDLTDFLKPKSGKPTAQHDPHEPITKPSFSKAEGGEPTR